MFTKNYDNFMLTNAGYITDNEATNNSSVLTEANYLSDNNVISRKYNAISTSTSSFCAGPILIYDTDSSRPSNIFHTFGLLIAQGNTAPTYYDYKMAGTVIYSGLSTSGVTNLLTITTQLKARSYVDSGTGKKYVRVTFEVRNNTANSVTFQEIGFAPRMGIYTSSGSSFTSQYLLWREVLPSAVTLASGELWQYQNDIELPDFRPNKPSA